MKKIWYIILLSAILGCTIVITWSEISSPVVSERITTDFKLLPVSVFTLKKKDYTPVIDRFGLAKSARITTIPAIVSGEVVKVFPDFTVGKRVAKDTPLAMTDSLSYKLAVAEKEKALLDAKIELQLEEQRKIQAKANWKRLGKKTLSMPPLVARDFQVEAAKSQVEVCNVALEVAKNNLAHTTIMAPYDAAVISKDIAIGTYVAVGQTIGTVYDSSLMEVHFPLSELNISKLGITDLNKINDQKISVKIISTTNPSITWNGTLRYLDLQVSLKTREQKAIAEVVDPLNTTPPLLPNTFVKVEIAGKKLQNVFTVPEKSLLQDGYLWVVNAENKLEHYFPEVLFRKDGILYIKNTKGLSKIRIIANPMGVYTEGMEIIPEETACE